MTEIFIEATRKKFRFPSEKGELTVEQLWDLPLTSRNGFNLNSVAIAVNTELRGLTEESFVEVNPNPRRSQHPDMLEIIKYVIATKQEENKAANERAAKETLKERIREAIAAKRNEQLNSTSLEELEAQLAALGG
jgi:hypothetical protein